jgi:integrase
MRIETCLVRGLRDAKIEDFCVYSLRHSCASRLSAAGVSDQFVAQLIGHSTTSILQTYVRAIDEYRRRAIHQLDSLRRAQVLEENSSEFSTSASGRNEYKN